MRERVRERKRERENRPVPNIRFKMRFRVSQRETKEQEKKEKLDCLENEGRVILHLFQFCFLGLEKQDQEDVEMNTLVSEMPRIVRYTRLL